MRGLDAPPPGDAAAVQAGKLAAYGTALLCAALVSSREPFLFIIVAEVRKFS
jgi:hypothetical protein